ncbi:MAG: ABC transporter substrate-binding protein [Streptomycetaceae bacterium]|nr:ABC transporter substrate-binding protein [Streptomycetaceae bacterium]
MVLAFALALALSACAGGGGKNSAAGDPDAQVRSGGRITLLAVQDPRSLDPFGTSNIAVADEPRMAALYDPMFYFDPADSTVKPFIGESLTTADSGRTWTMKIRPGVRFSDGTPFDAEAVRLTYEAHARPETQSLRRAAATGLKMRVLDPLTLEITPPTPNAAFDRTVALHLAYVIAPSALAKGPDFYRTNPVGAGPFKLERWSRGSEQVFVRNPDYWQKDKGLPKLDGFNVKVLQDPEQQYAAVKSGAANLVYSTNGELLDRAEKEMGAQPLRVNGGYLIQFNTTRPPFDDLRARRAIALALDPADLQKTLNTGLTPAKGLFQQDSSFYEPSAAQPAPDRAEAQRLLNELAAEGKKLDFSFLVPQNPRSSQLAEYIQSRLATLDNVAMRTESLEIGSYVTKYAIQRDYQAMSYQEFLPDPEPGMFTSYMSASPLNYAGWKNPDADRALLAARASADPAVRKQAYADFQRAFQHDLPVWVHGESVIGAMYNKIGGVKLFNTGTAFMDRIGLLA